VHDEAALLADEQDQLVAGHTPFAVETAHFLLKFLTAAQGALGQTLLLDALVLLEGIVHEKPPKRRWLKHTPGATTPPDIDVTFERRLTLDQPAVIEQLVHDLPCTLNPFFAVEELNSASADWRAATNSALKLRMMSRVTDALQIKSARRIPPSAVRFSITRSVMPTPSVRVRRFR
jgi:hypothetical protein